MPESHKTEDEDFIVWSENWKAWQLFLQMSTQWRVSMSGATGLDYPSLAAIFAIQGVNKKQQKKLFQQIRLIENGALQAMRENAK